MFARRLPQRVLIFIGTLLIYSIFILAPAHSKTKTIRYHPGGGVTTVYMDVIRADKKGTRVRIAGKCMSACTLFLASKKVCVTKRASFKFHQARNGYGSRNKPGPNLQGTRFLMEKYPPRLRSWIRRQGGLPWNGWLTLNASTAVKHGIARYC